MVLSSVIFLNYGKVFMIANANVLVERLTERAMFMLDEISNWMK